MAKMTPKITENGQDEAQDGQDEAQDNHKEAHDGQDEAQSGQDEAQDSTRRHAWTHAPLGATPIGTTTAQQRYNNKTTTRLAAAELPRRRVRRCFLTTLTHLCSKVDDPLRFLFQC